VIWSKKATLKFVMIWSQNFVGVKGLRFVLLVGSSLTCIFIVIWGNESCFEFCYNLKLNFFHCDRLAICFVIQNYFEICCNLELNVVKGLKFVSNCF